MVSDSNKFVLIRSEGRVSVGKQLVLRTASTYQLLVKAASWLHWDWLLKWWGCTATTRWSVTVGMQITSINESAGFTYCRIPGVGVQPFLLKGQTQLNRSDRGPRLRFTQAV